MSWDELPTRKPRTTRAAWAVCVHKNVLTVWLPDGHWLTAASVAAVKSSVGKGEHAGWLRIEPKEHGRVVCRAKGAARYLRYSAIPFMPTEFNLIQLGSTHVRDDGARSVEIELPWFADGRPLALAAQTGVR